MGCAESRPDDIVKLSKSTNYWTAGQKEATVLAVAATEGYWYWYRLAGGRRLQIDIRF